MLRKSRFEEVGCRDNEVEDSVAAEIYFTHKFKDKPLMVELALNADNEAAMKKLDGPIAFAGSKTQLPVSSPRKLFVERTEAYNAEVKRIIAETGKADK